MADNEFKVNEYLSLKLEDGSTVIYVNGERFNQCRFLLLNIPVKEIKSLDAIESIDEAAERLDRSRSQSKISPKTEFWGHCSNLQAWAENNYNTRLLHRNIAFPLLKKLTDIGDPVAKKVFKEEIAKRCASGYPSIVEYLSEGGYLNYLSEEKRGLLFEQIDLNSLLDLDDTKLFPFLKKFCRAGISIAKKIFKDEITKRFVSGSFLDIEYLLKKNYLTYLSEEERGLLFEQIDLNSLLDLDDTKLFPFLKKFCRAGISIAKKIFKDEITKRFVSGSFLDIEYLLKKNYLTYFNETEIETLFSNIDISSILKLDLSKEGFQILPKYITKLTSLQELNLSSNNLKTLPEPITKLSSLIYLDLRHNQLTTLPESIGNLTSLQTLHLEGIDEDLIGYISNGNELKTLPESIGNLTSLRELDLRSNKLSTLPESIGNLKSLTYLDLYNNELLALPESITKLTSLQTLDLGSNRFTTLPESITKLTSLQTLDLGSNRFTTLPESITNLKSLTSLSLSSNKFSTLPESIGNLSSLKELHLYNNKITTFPESIPMLTSLQTLNLKSNKLSTLPESIIKLESLEVLSLGRNKFTTIPESIGNLKSLQKLKLEGNKLSSRSKSILKQLKKNGVKIHIRY